MQQVVDRYCHKLFFYDNSLREAVSVKCISNPTDTSEHVQPCYQIPKTPLSDLAAVTSMSEKESLKCAAVIPCHCERNYYILDILCLN